VTGFDDFVRAVELTTGQPGRRVGKETRLLCPAHDDHDPSLDVRQGEDGRPLVQCRSHGCTFEAICEEIGSDPSEFLTSREDGEWTPRGPAVAVYPYTDAAGQLLYEVCRTADKQFPQRRPDPNSKSGYRWKLDDVERVLYQLPKLGRAAAAGELVYIVEGEKDVEALERAGAVATCNPGGAGKWRSDYSEALRGARVVAITDNDEAGLAHAGQVVASLRRAGVIVERVCRAAVGKDATDHFAAGRTLDELVDVDLPASTEAQRELGLPPPNAPMKVARLFARECYTREGLSTLRHWRGGWCQWRDSRWVELEQRAMQAAAYRFTEYAAWVDAKGEEKPWAPNRHKIGDLLDALASFVHTPEEMPMPSWLDGTAYDGLLVSCANGLLDVGSRRLVEHTPGFFNATSVPFEYDAKAGPPRRWLSFLGELWPEDVDSIAALQEWFGYTISGRTDLHKILLLVGPTRAGKGVTARILGALVGTENVAGPTLASLNGDFGLAPLLGKTLAVVSDARLNGRAHNVVERLLSISGEDTLTVNRKYREQWTGKLPTRLMLCSNELPQLGDASMAIAGRFVPLLLVRSWLGQEDHALELALREELPAILNWSLDGLERLASTGRFTRSLGADEAVVALQDLASPVAAFVRDRCLRDSEQEVAVDEIYRAFRLWAEDNGHVRATKQVFGRDLRAAIPGLRVGQFGPHEDRIRVYRGLGLREETPS